MTHGIIVGTILGITEDGMAAGTVVGIDHGTDGAGVTHGVLATTVTDQLGVVDTTAAEVGMVEEADIMAHQAMDAIVEAVTEELDVLVIDLQ